MKTNKKAILGMLVAMVMSLGVMGGMSAKNHDANLQQIGCAASYVSGVTEGGASTVFSYVANFCATVSGGMTVYGVAATASTGGAASVNPIGAGYWIADGAIFL